MKGDTPTIHRDVRMERLVRIELTLIAWKAIVLPLNYRRMYCDEFYTGKREFLQLILVEILLEKRKFIVI